MDEMARKQLYRRAFNTDAGRQALADICARAGVHAANLPVDANGRMDALATAHAAGARSVALDIMRCADVEFVFEFPPLKDAARPTDIDTEKAA